MIKIIIAIIVIVPLAGGVVYYAMNKKTMDFESVCDPQNKKYTKRCENIGKRAYSIQTVAKINEKDFGPIIGVAWRRKGSIISSRGMERRYSEKNSYYYIIGSDKNNYQFLRMVDETDAR